MNGKKLTEVFNSEQDLKLAKLQTDVDAMRSDVQDLARALRVVEHTNNTRYAAIHMVMKDVNKFIDGITRVLGR